MKEELPSPALVLDTREDATRAALFTLPVTTAGLYTGDVSIAGLETRFAIELKWSLADLVGSLSADRDRFQREVIRLRGYEFRRLLLVGDPGLVLAHTYRSKMSPKAVLHSLHAIEARGLPVVWVDDAAAAAALVERWAVWFAREARRGVMV